MKQARKQLIAINLAIYAGLLFLPPLLFYVYKSTKLANTEKPQYQNLNINPAFPTAEDKNHAAAMQRDSKNVKSELIYRSFIGWRRSPYNSQYSNVLAPYNNRDSFNSSFENSTWFFGGSTIWGTGASDDQTIPSWYAKIAKVPVLNLGETAWTSRQSVNQFLNLLGDGYRPSQVIFYDGVNDIIHGCRVELPDVPAHTQEPLITNSLRPFSSILVGELKTQFAKAQDFIAAPYKALGAKLGIYTPAHRPYGGLDCSKDHRKAQLVASHLVNNWHSAYLLAKAHGAKFKAVLQPHIFSTKNMDISYLNTSEFYLKDEHNTVYPLIKKEINARCKIDPGFCSSFIDGSGWLDSHDPVYLDFAHITGRGNKIIAESLSHQ